MAVALLFAATRGIVAGDRDVRHAETFRGGTIPGLRKFVFQIGAELLALSASNA